MTHLASLVLGDLVLGVLPALLALAVGLTGLGNVDLFVEKPLISNRPSYAFEPAHAVTRETFELGYGGRSYILLCCQYLGL